MYFGLLIDYQLRFQFLPSAARSLPDIHFGIGHRKQNKRYDNTIFYLNKYSPTAGAQHFPDKPHACNARKRPNENEHVRRSDVCEKAHTIGQHDAPFNKKQNVKSV